MKVKNSLNANEFEKNYLVFTQPSQTVPDQTMSMRTILERYARGLPVGGRLDEYYDEDDTMPDYRTLDLVDIQNLKDEVKETFEKHKKKVINNVDNSVENSERVEKTDETES
jgi:hypothetical protein